MATRKKSPKVLPEGTKAARVPPIPFVTPDGAPPVRSLKELRHGASLIEALIHEVGSDSPIVERAHRAFGEMCRVSLRWCVAPGNPQPE